MRRQLQIGFTVFVLLTASCNLPSQTPEALPASQTPIVDTPLAAVSTSTLVPVETLLAIPTATFVPTTTPRLTVAVSINQPVNCRYGPSTAYAVIGGLEVGRQAEVVGRSADSAWWYVKNPSDPSTFCWLAASVVDVVGNTNLPEVTPAPVQVTGIQLEVSPPSLNVSCTSFPQYVTVTAEIVTNGPSTVKWRWETSEGEMFDKEPLLFLEAGSQGGLLYYRVNAAKDYWFQVHILSPNDTTGRTIFKAICTP